MQSWSSCKACTRRSFGNEFLEHPNSRFKPCVWVVTEPAKYDGPVKLLTKLKRAAVVLAFLSQDLLATAALRKNSPRS